MRQYRVASVSGIPINVDLTLLLVLPVLTVVIGFQIDTWIALLEGLLGVDLQPATLQAGSLPWILGGVAALGLFLSVLGHELGHALVARRYGVSVTGITLWLFGGIASLDRTPREPTRELAIAVAGPLVSVGAAVGAWLLAGGLPAGEALGTQTVLFLLGYLVLMNTGLAAFNMLPAFPMDGGRVLRAVLARSRSYPDATALAALVGKTMAVLLGLLGTLLVNPLLIGIAVFVYVAAGREARRTAFQATLEDMQVGDLMTPAAHLDVVEADVSAGRVLEKMFDERRNCYPVRRDGRVVGTVALDDLRAVERVDRDVRTTGEIMREGIGSVTPDAHPLDALHRMDRTDGDRLLVIDRDEFTGLVSRADLRAVAAGTERSESPGSLNPRP